MSSRKEILYCENCNTVCHYDYGFNRWISDKGPMFTGKHCSSECYESIKEALELEFRISSENRTNIVRRLNMFRQMDQYRCKECGSVMRQCWCNNER